MKNFFGTTLVLSMTVAFSAPVFAQEDPDQPQVNQEHVLNHIDISAGDTQQSGDDGSGNGSNSTYKNLGVHFGAGITKFNDDSVGALTLKADVIGGSSDDPNAHPYTNVAIRGFGGNRWGNQGFFQFDVMSNSVTDRNLAAVTIGIQRGIEGTDTALNPLGVTVGTKNYKVAECGGKIGVFWGGSDKALAVAQCGAKIAICGSVGDSKRWSGCLDVAMLGNLGTQAGLDAVMGATLAWKMYADDSSRGYLYLRGDLKSSGAVEFLNGNKTVGYEQTGLSVGVATR